MRERIRQQKNVPISDLDGILSELLSEYREALADGDRERLRGLLRDGRLAKEKVDG